MREPASHLTTADRVTPIASANSCWVTAAARRIARRSSGAGRRAASRFAARTDSMMSATMATYCHPGLHCCCCCEGAPEPGQESGHMTHPVDPFLRIPIGPRDARHAVVESHLVVHETLDSTRQQVAVYEIAEADGHMIATTIWIGSAEIAKQAPCGDAAAYPHRHKTAPPRQNAARAEAPSCRRQRRQHRTSHRDETVPARDPGRHRPPPPKHRDMRTATKTSPTSPSCTPRSQPTAAPTSHATFTSDSQPKAATTPDPASAR